MIVGFRVDAAPLIGNGHLARCTALAKMLRTKGHKCLFISKQHHGNMFSLIREDGFDVIELTNVRNAYITEDTSTWLSSSQQEDAEETILKLSAFKLDWLVVDHYTIDHTWQILLRPYCQRIMVIDDLANRKHDCDLLLDQTLSRKASDYRSLTPIHCQILTGSDFTLLRDEFGQLRSAAIIKRNLFTTKGSKNVLVTMGGSDPQNLTTLVIDAIGNQRNEFPGITATVVLSSNAFHLSAIQVLSRSYSWLSLKVNTVEMHELMLIADVAIGACGSTSWERCCLGLPSIAVVTADNQLTTSKALQESQASIVLTTSDKLTLQSIQQELRQLLTNNALYHYMSEQAFLCCDGGGAVRVANELLNITYLKPADMSDIDIIYQWQSTPEIRQYARNPNIVSKAEHFQWFQDSLMNSERSIFIIYHDRKPAGVLRFDKMAACKYEVSILIAPEKQGLGIAKVALTSIIPVHFKNNQIYAYVDSKNTASQRLFEASGFSRLNNNEFLKEPY